MRATLLKRNIAPENFSLLEGVGKKDSCALMLGRFNPLHKGHAQCLREMFMRYNHPYIMLGSCNDDRDLSKNPFSAWQREEMIRCAMPSGRVITTDAAQQANKIPNFLRHSDVKYEGGISPLYQTIITFCETHKIPVPPIELFYTRKPVDIRPDGTHHLDHMGRIKDVKLVDFGLSEEFEHASATLVREVLKRGDILELRKLVPLPVADFIMEAMIAASLHKVSVGQLTSSQKLDKEVGAFVCSLENYVPVLGSGGKVGLAKSMDVKYAVSRIEQPHLSRFLAESEGGRFR